MTEQPERDDQTPGPTLGQAVAEAIARLRRIWRQIDGPDLIAEYRRVLTNLGDPAVIRAATDAVIDGHDAGGYPPVPGAIVAAGRDHLGTPEPTPEPRHVPSAADPNRYVLVYPDGRRYPPGARTVEDTRTRTRR